MTADKTDRVSFSSAKQMAAGSSSRLPTEKKKPLWKRMLQSYQLYILILPTIIWYAIFCYAPMYGVQIAFKDYIGILGITKSPWVGLEHFRSFFRTYYCWDIIRNTFVLSVYCILAAMPFPILLALMLNEVKQPKFKKAAQTIFYAPHFISTVVLVGMLNIFFTSHGFFNIVRQFFGLDAVNYMMNVNAFRHMYVWSGIWQGTGWGCIIYLAALSAVDPSLHEAATIDGATRLQRIWYINIPAILPTFTILLIMDAGGILSIGFDKVFLMSNSVNLPKSNVLSLYIYQRGLVEGNFGFSTAIGLLNSLVSLSLVLIVNWIAGKVSDSTLF